MADNSIAYSQLGGSSAFATTRWTLVLQAGADSGNVARQALADLCRAYWLPLYVYVRRRGYSPHDAEDLTQGFFADLLERGSVAKADRARGQFRTFLLTAISNFVENAREHAHAMKRGGGVEKLSIDTREADVVLAQLSDASVTPDQAFDRSWAIALLDRAMRRLRAEQARLGKEQQFDRYWPHLQGRAETGIHDRLGAEFGLTRNAVAVAMHRLSSRYRELVRAEVAETVGTREDWAEEQRELLGVLER